MKKVLAILLLMTSMFTLIACHGKTKLTVEIKGTKDYTLIQYEQLPTFLEGVKAIGNDDNDYTQYIEVKHQIKTDKVETYDLIFEVHFNGEVLAIKHQKVTITEYIKPIVTYVIDGPESIELLPSQTKQDILEKYSVKDNQGNVIDVEIVIDDATVNYQKSGTYAFTITANHTLFNLVRHLYVIITEAPKPVVNYYIEGPESIELSFNQTQTDILEAYSVKDDQGNVTDAEIMIDDATVNYQKEGIYQATLMVFIETVDLVKNISITVKNDSIKTSKLGLFYLNDTHGAIVNRVIDEQEQLGLSRIDNHIRNYRIDHEDTLTLFLAGGDMLQGQMISNYFDGASTMAALNAMNLDAFVLGNHEFDWGLEKVLQYFNGKHDIQATYPLLGANIYEKATNQRPEGIKPYTVIQKEGIKVGIIGVIGNGLESSIAKSKVEAYEFRDAYTAVETYTEILKQQENVDFIIVVNHDEDNTFNQNVAKLGVDIIFNGHTHKEYIKTTNGVSVMQTGANSENLGYAAFEKDTNGKWNQTSIENLDSYDSEYLNQNSPVIDEVLSLYEEEVNEIGDEVIIKNNQKLSRTILTNYMAKLMALKTGADIAFHNYGGTRTDMSATEDFTLKKLYAIFPFDNVVVTFNLKGSYIKEYMRGYGKNYYIDSLKHTNIEDDVIYKVAVNDYSYGAESIFKNHASNIELTDIVLRNLIQDALLQQAKTHTYFDHTVNYMPQQIQYAYIQ